LAALLAVPLIKEGRWVASFAVQHLTPREWSEAEARLLQETAERTWAAVERARAEAALRASEARHCALFDSVDEGVCLFERLPPRPDGLRDYRYLAMNPAMQAMFGIPDLSGQSIRDNFPDEVEDWYDDYDRVLETGEPIRFERASAPQGMVLEMFVSRLEDGSGKRLLAVMQDVTERKQREQQQVFLLTLSDVLRAEPEADAIAHRALTMLFGQLRLDRCYVGVYRLAEDRADFTHQVGNDRVPPVPGSVRLSDFPDALRIAFDRTLVIHDVAETEGLTDTDRRNLGALGFRALVAATLRQGGNNPLWSIVTISGSPRRWTRSEVALIEDVTERTWAAMERAKAEGALRESEARFRTLSDAVPQVIWSNSADGTATYFNQRWYEYSGLTYEESVGPGWQAIVHPDDAPASVEKWQQALASGDVFDTEYRLRRHDGVYRWFLGRNVPMKDREGKVTGWFGTATDIEAWKQAQAAVQASEERFRLLVEGARDYAIFLLSPVNRIVYWSVGAERVFGWTEEEAIGRDGSFIFTPEDQEQGEPEKEEATARKQGRAIDRRWHVRKDGSRFWADGFLMRLDDEAGSVRGFVKITRDATEQKRAEEALQAALEAVALANEQLEQRVQERTRELSSALEQLSNANTMRRELLRRLVNAQEEERGHIARELHDNTGQLITGLSLGLNNLPAALPSPLPDPAAQLLTRMRQMTDELGAEAHRLSANLRPTALDQMGLVPALRNYTEQWSSWSGLPVEYETVGFNEEIAGLSSGQRGDRLPREVESTIYRIVQEALTNILRHASPNRPEARAKPTDSPSSTNGSRGSNRGRRRAAKSASRVSVLLQRTDRHLIATVEDDGPGFDVEAVMNLPPDKRRLGLFGMTERAELVGGTLEIESTVGMGTTVFLRVPMTLPSEQTGGKSEPG
jgi:PAS domain S-box-containing protein